MQVQPKPENTVASPQDAPRARGKEQPGYVRAFEDLPREHGYEPLQIEGKMPRALQGTLYRCGPALMSSFERPYGHWFDGDGAVTAIRLGDKKPRGAVRLVRSLGLGVERAEGRPVTGGFGTSPPRWRALAATAGILPGEMVFKNAANTSALRWQQRLFALWEGGPPTELDADSLATLGTTRLGGVLRTFSAHPHYVPQRGATYNFGLRYGRHTKLDLYELPDEGAARRISRFRLERPYYVHDFAVTERHAVFFLSPACVQPWKMLLGATFRGSIRWTPDAGSHVLVIPLDDPDRPRWLETEAFFHWHIGNAFERRNRAAGSTTDEIVVDMVRNPEIESTLRWTETLPWGLRGDVEVAAMVWRARLDLHTGRVRWQQCLHLPCEFPQVHPAVRARPYRYLWVAAFGSPEATRCGPWDRIVRLDMESGDWETWRAGESAFVSEPVVAPHSPKEHDASVLTMTYDASRHESALSVVAAGAPADGAKAHAWFGHHIPPSLHGTWEATNRNA